MAAKKDVKLIRELETKDQFEAALSDPTRLFIVDVYDEWYGPCTQLEPTMKSLSINTENWDMRCAILTINIDRVPEFHQKYGPPTKPKSKPLLLMYRGGKIVGEVMGCDAPEILRLINEHLPVYKPEEE